MIWWDERPARVHQAVVSSETVLLESRFVEDGAPTPSLTATVDLDCQYVR